MSIFMNNSVIQYTAFNKSLKSDIQTNYRRYEQTIIRVERRIKTVNISNTNEWICSISVKTT